MKLKPIKTKRDYKNALKRIDELIAKDPKENTEAFDELDIWGTLLVAYEEIHYPIETPNPLGAGN